MHILVILVKRHISNFPIEAHSNETTHTRSSKQSRGEDPTTAKHKIHYFTLNCNKYLLTWMGWLPSVRGRRVNPTRASMGWNPSHPRHFCLFLIFFNNRLASKTYVNSWLCIMVILRLFWSLLVLYVIPL